MVNVCALTEQQTRKTGRNSFTIRTEQQREREEGKRERERERVREREREREGINELN